MTLGDIAQRVGATVDPADADLRITDLHYDSRRVVPGCLFFCLVGQQQDGHDFVLSALEAGAAALVCEREVRLPAQVRIPRLQVGNARRAMSMVASEFFGDPSRRLQIAGVTGTNGKTTTCFLLESIFRAAGDPAGLIGTIECHVAGEIRPATRTTPESVDIQRLLADMARAGARRCAMEATSIGIDSDRMAGMRLQTAVFTNLSHDHLDYHPDMDAYYAAKRRLFTDFDPAAAVINADDEYGRRLLDLGFGNAVSFGTGERAQLRAINVRYDARGSSFVVRGLGVEQSVHLRLPGAFNISNALAAFGAALTMGIDAEAAARGIEHLAAVPGRFEPVDEGQDFLVIVDYAHTPDGLVNVLRAARDLAEKRVIAVFGCGGDRDKAKRPLMARAVADAADAAYITSDNPRREDPRQILMDIEAGLADSPPPGGYVIIEDRAEAIEAAVRRAEPGDVVVLAGKGHEPYQEVRGRVLPFDDRRVAAEMLRKIR